MTMVLERPSEAAGKDGVDVYVPAPGYLEFVDPGSGIVGMPRGTGVEIYFEGNRLGAANIKTYADRVYHAAGRMRESYPTVARARVSAEEVVLVGTFDGSQVILEDAEAESRVANWLGEPFGLDPAELVRT